MSGESNRLDTLGSFFSGIMSHHALEGSLRLDSKAALMSRIALCAKKTPHSMACHLSLMARSKWAGHVETKQTVKIGKTSRAAQDMILRTWRCGGTTNRSADAKRLHMECNSRCSDRAKIQSNPPCAKIQTSQLGLT